ncbi:IclR family transcriptional regulator [Allopusillimonas ginsengisoli]|uniref:IclR family transcriptional regulator n=1 Tax=Allopusillimonas ginsengisoli TaxID=453575 RepID=UPI001021BAA0|nr:IclR family transcriptional regulator [Allopusillimonas ginsengisoli]TEA78275.1 IclR family transcriptional regulator [Allopusillimonas ginsengisoli]
MDKTLVKGLSVLEFLVERAAPCSVSEVAKAFSLVPSNAHRTLNTLVALGYAKQMPDSRYQPSLRLFELGSKVVGMLDIRHIAHQAMAELAAGTMETIHLVVRDGSQVVYLDKVDSPQPVAAYSHIGGRAPAQCVASGKALLAHALPGDKAQALRWLRDTLPALEPYTAFSHLKHDALLDDLLLVRQQGYALNRGEWREDVSGLGAPVFDGHGQVVGALGISLPSIRATPERLPELIAPLREAAASTSALLGHRPNVAVAPVPAFLTQRV